MQGIIDNNYLGVLLDEQVSLGSTLQACFETKIETIATWD